MFIQTDIPTTGADMASDADGDTQSIKRSAEDGTVSEAKRAKVSPTALTETVPEDELDSSRLQKPVAPQTKRIAVRLAR